MKFVKSSCWARGLEGREELVLNIKCKLSHIQFSQFVASANIAGVSKNSNVVTQVRLKMTVCLMANEDHTFPAHKPETNKLAFRFPERFWWARAPEPSFQQTLNWHVLLNFIRLQLTWVSITWNVEEARIIIK